MTDAIDASPVSLRLSADEALVLAALLARLEETHDGEDALPVVDPAERGALWSLGAALESVLVAPFSGDYDALLAAARQRVRHTYGL